MGSTSNIFDLLQQRKERAAKGPSRAKGRRHSSVLNGDHITPNSSRAPSTVNSRVNSSSNFYEGIKSEADGASAVDYNKIRDMFSTPPDAGNVVFDDDTNETEDNVIRIRSADRSGPGQHKQQGRKVE